MLSVVQLGLKIIFLILLYLFLYVLIRMITKDLKEGAAKKPIKRSAEAIRKPRLVILESTAEKAGKVFPFTQEFIIGRDPENDMFLKDVFVSKQHCLIYKHGKKILIKDLGSSNGTFLNGEKIDKPEELRVGDKIRVSQTTFKFVE